jgi:RNA polymerase sigma-70 factor (ECF subfamily)
VKSDEELMLAYCAGDVAAFRELFSRYAPVLGKALRRFGPTEAQLADLVQQTFLQLHRARHDFRQGAELRPWIFTIAFNLAREQLRRHRRRPESALEATDGSEHAQPPLGQHGFELRSDMSRALGQLPPDQREVIVLHFVEELTFEEIAQKLGATAGAIRVRAHRGYQTLRKLLEVGNATLGTDIDQKGVP